MFEFLRALGLDPLEWNQAIKLTKKAAPYVAEILDAAFNHARAVVVLMTPDDVVQLRADLLKRGDGPSERKPTGQARPNVLFEAGLAFATHPTRTIFVELGKMRGFSDVAGRHTVRMNGGAAARSGLAMRLANAGCRVNQTGTDWLTAGKFEDPLKRKKR
jgi:predicted nucleotide-binding protein